MRVCPSDARARSLTKQLGLSYKGVNIPHDSRISLIAMGIAVQKNADFPNLDFLSTSGRKRSLLSLSDTEPAAWGQIYPPE